jgi:hypothetical protein
VADPGARAAGFVAEEPDTVLIGLAAELATTPAPPPGLALRWVTADADMRRIAAMESDVWGQDWSWLGENLIGRIAAAPDDIAVLTAEADGEVVSAAWLAVIQPGADGAARLLGGSTRPRWRGRGLWSLPARSGRPHAASSTCRSTPLMTAPQSCAAWDSTR